MFEKYGKYEIRELWQQSLKKKFLEYIKGIPTTKIKKKHTHFKGSTVEYTEWSQRCDMIECFVELNKTKLILIKDTWWVKLPSADMYHNISYVRKFFVKIGQLYLTRLKFYPYFSGNII